jgi:hypothetical protein
MGQVRQIKTSAEVYAVLHARHRKELKVFSSYSAPDGDQYGDPEKCVMRTEWGFEESENPFIGAETTWDKDHDKPYNRINEKTKYWLCILPEGS